MRVDANVSVRTTRRRAVRHSLRDQEPQLGPLARPRHRVRGAPPDRAARAQASRSARRRATGTRTTAARTRCGRRRRPTTTATSPSPTWCRSRPTRRGSTGSGRALPLLPGERRRPPGARRRRGRRPTPAWRSPSIAAGRPAPRRHRAGRRSRPGCWSTSSTTWPSTGPDAVPRRRRSPRSTQLEVGGRRSPPTQAKQVLADLVAAGGDGDPAALAAAQGFEAMDDGRL